MGMSDYVRGLRRLVGTELLFMPSVACMIRDDEGRMLLVRHVEGRWMLPGGVVDPGERPADAARRECWEEAGIVVDPVRIAGVFGGPEHHTTYENGDNAGWIVTVFDAVHPRGRAARTRRRDAGRRLVRTRMLIDAREVADADPRVGAWLIGARGASQLTWLPPQ